MRVRLFPIFSLIVLSVSLLLRDALATGLDRGHFPDRQYFGLGYMGREALCAALFTRLSSSRDYLSVAGAKEVVEDFLSERAVAIQDYESLFDTFPMPHSGRPRALWVDRSNGILGLVFPRDHYLTSQKVEAIATALTGNWGKLGINAIDLGDLQVDMIRPKAVLISSISGLERLSMGLQTDSTSEPVPAILMDALKNKSLKHVEVSVKLADSTRDLLPLFRANLDSLDVRFRSPSTAESLETLIAATQIPVIRISVASLRQEGFRYYQQPFIDALAANSKILALYLYTREFEDVLTYPTRAEALKLISGLAQSRSIEYLALPPMDGRPAGLLNGLWQMPKLKGLDLSLVRDYLGMDNSLAALAGHPTLEKIVLSAHVDIDSAKPYLRKIPNLKSVVDPSGKELNWK